VVDISRLELRGVEERDGALHVGPLTTWSDLGPTTSLTVVHARPLPAELRRL